MQQIQTSFKPALYQRHSKTSKAAAWAIEPKRASGRGILLAFLRSRGPMGATDEEMQRWAPMNDNTQRPRRGELVKGGFIHQSGTTRATTSGHDAVVWLANEWRGV
jgi:hypothetical protein